MGTLFKGSLFSACDVTAWARKVRPKRKDSCVQVLEVKNIKLGRSKNIFILDFFFITNVQRLK